mgnify:CR=1 FL=1
MAISFSAVANGAANDGSVLSANFAKVNTELFTTKLAPEEALQNPRSDFMIGPFFVATVAGGANAPVFRIKTPGTLDDVIVPLRASISFDSNATNGDATLDIKEDNTTILTSVLTATAVDSVFTRDSFADSSIAANSTLSFHVAGVTAAVSGVTVALWCKSRHRA